MAIPSFKLVYQQDVIPEADMTVKVIGHQWYWEYQYPEHFDITFESYMVPDEDLEEGEVRLLTVDNKLVLPVNKNIHVLVTAGDVLHSFAMPSLGVKKDAVPGRLNETWMNIEKPGIYRGQVFRVMWNWSWLHANSNRSSYRGRISCSLGQWILKSNTQ